MPGYQYNPGGSTISGLTTNRLPKALSASTLGNSLLSDDGTNVSLLSGRLKLPAPASAATPAINATADTTTGINIVSGLIRFISGGTLQMVLSGSLLDFSVGGSLCIRSNPGSVGAPGLRIDNGGSIHGLYSPSADDIALGANSTECIRVTGTAGALNTAFSTGIKFLTATKTTTYTLTVADHIIFADATTAAFTITLPAASASTVGKVWQIFKIDASVNAVTISRAGADTINGAASKALATQNLGIQIVGLTSTTWLATTLVAA